MARHPSVTRPGKFIQDSRHCAWHCQVHFLGDAQGTSLEVHSFSEGTPPESCPQCLSSLSSPQITSPLRSAHLSFIIILSLVFRLHFELFEGSRPVSSVILRCALFLPLPEGILTTVLSKITGLFPFLDMEMPLCWMSAPAFNWLVNNSVSGESPSLAGHLAFLWPF